MGEPARNDKPQSTALDGLSEFFDRSVDPPRPETKPTADQGWALWQAADAYKVTERTIRRWIKEQRVTAWKVDGPRGPEWRINPGSSQEDSNVQSGSSDPNQALIALTKILSDQAAKLEAATFRNGFLEAQTRVYEEQVKLLPDFQAQAAKAAAHGERVNELENELVRIKASWWYRFSAWLSKGTNA